MKGANKKKVIKKE